MDAAVDRVSESVVVPVPAEDAYAAVADLRRMGEWSPECFRVWLRGEPRPGTKFVGFNRRGPLVWFTNGQIAVADPGVEFAFDVFSFGMSVARWSYRFAPVDGGTEITEEWTDHRQTRTLKVIGRLFTGVAADKRPEINREGMRATLERLRTALSRA